MRAAGSSGADIAAAVGVGVSTAHKIAWREGMPLLRRGPPAKADRNGAILAMRADGKTLAAIGVHFGVSFQRVGQIVARGKAP